MSADSSSLWGLCKQRGITSLSKVPVPKQVNALLSHPDGPPPPSALPIRAGKTTKASKASKTSKGGQPAARPAPQNRRPWSSASIGWSGWRC